MVVLDIKLQEHKVNECVFAKWTDCRMYAARILNIKANGMCEQLRFHGICCEAKFREALETQSSVHFIK